MPLLVIVCLIVLAVTAVVWVTAYLIDENIEGQERSSDNHHRRP